MSDKKHLRLVGDTKSKRSVEYTIYPMAMHFHMAAAMMANSWDEYTDKEEQDKEDADKADCLVNLAEEIAFSMWMTYSAEEDTPGDVQAAMIEQGMIPVVVKKDEGEEEEPDEEAEGE